MRKTFRICCLSLLFPLAAAAVTPPPAQRPDEAAAHPARGALADRDGDRLSDGLQATLATAGAAERFAVVATFTPAGDPAAAHQALGPFERHREFSIIRGFAATMTAAQIRTLAQMPGVFRIEEDFTVRTQLDAARPDFGVDAAQAAYGGLHGDGIGVCVVDTGVDPNHEQINGKPLTFANFVDPTKTTAYDDHGHGTHVSSIAAGDGIGGSNAARYRGIAPAAALYVAKVLDAGGSGPESAVIDGIQWCANEPGVRVISMSLGSGVASDGKDGMSQAVDSAVNLHGKVVVVAAGNDGDLQQTVGSPGAAAKAITVGACAEWSAPRAQLNHSDGVYLAPWSSRGPTLDNRTKPDVCAPGHSITAAKAGSVTGYVVYSGTSMATPFVAGMVALALQEKPSLTPLEVSAALEASAQGRGPAGKNNDWGAGLVDAYAFVTRLAGGSEATAFPSYTRIAGSVGQAPARWSHSFSVAEVDPVKPIPIAATITVDGQANCVLSLGPLGCLAWEWSPDLDAELYDPTGTLLATAGCMGIGECGAVGRQESLHAMPTVAGQYRIDVYGAQDDVNRGKGGSFTLDLSLGPLAGAAPPSPSGDFSLGGCTSLTIRRGKSASCNETVTPSNGFTGSITLNISGLPNGVTGQFDPVSVVAPGSSTLKLSAATTARRGTYTLTITGTGGSLIRTSALNLVIK